MLGSFAITPLSEMLRAYFGGKAAGLHLAIYGGVLVIVMLYFQRHRRRAAALGATAAERRPMTALLEVRT